MTQVDIPVVPLAEAPLSARILSHLTDLAATTGRYVCFWDARDIRKADPSFPSFVKARAIADPNKPFLAIVVDMGEMSRSRYQAARHDPFIAHEAGHLALWTQGYRQIEYAGQPAPAQWAIDAASNWVTDPIINRGIQGLGFDMAADRTREINDSTKALNKGIWRKKPVEPSIRLAVSFILEPGIPEPSKLAFRQALNRGLAPFAVSAISRITEAIEGEVSSPKAHDAALNRCFHALNSTLGLGLRPPSFAPAYKRFKRPETERWVAAEVTTTKPWP